MTVVFGCDAPERPLPVRNRPGLSALRYRIGTYGSVRELMLERIAAVPELAALTSRSEGDYAVTLLELFAAVVDVLTFYQERYANEAFLRTATQRVSVERLAALIGFPLRPGAAALASLAFTLDPDKRLELSPGLRVQSVPDAQEKPQTFETIEPLEADARLNHLRIYPEPRRGSQFVAGATQLLLDRTFGPVLAADLAPGSRVIVFEDGGFFAPEEKRVAAVRLEEDRAVVDWTEPMQRTWGMTAKVFRVGRSFRLYGHDAPETYMRPGQAAGSPKRALPQEAQRLVGPIQGGSQGHPSGVTWTLVNLTSGDFVVPAPSSGIFLDARYEGIQSGQKLLLAASGAGGRSSLVDVSFVEQSRSTFRDFSGPSTRVKPVQTGLLPIPDRRSAVVYELLGDEIHSAEGTYDDRLAPTTVYIPGRSLGPGTGEIEVERAIARGSLQPGIVLRTTDFEPGRRVVLDDAEEDPIAARVHAPPAITPTERGSDFCHLVLQLDLDGPGRTLETASAFLVANVARASHGETVRDEVLGSGDASKRFQRFALKKSPLTYVPSDDPGGTTSSLEIRVDGVRWHEVPSLFAEAPDARVYVVGSAEDGTAVVQFGDGRTGAVVPTGTGNVLATYRVGLGRSGRVAERALRTVLDRSPGLAGALNPLPAEGGADPDTIDQARRAAPRTVRTFSRAVALPDFEELVEASGEVAKAEATWLWSGLERSVHLTVAGDQGAILSQETLDRLAKTLAAAHDPHVHVRLQNFVGIPVTIAASLRADPDRVGAETLEGARAAAKAALAFDAQELGRSLHLSEVYAFLQDVPGVVAVDVDGFQFKDRVTARERSTVVLENGRPAPLQPHLIVRRARYDPVANAVRPAELAVLEAPATDLVLSLQAAT